MPNVDDFPKNFQMMLQAPVEYEKNGVIIKGTVTDLRWFKGHIRNIKTGNKCRGVQMKLKPDNGTRAIWTAAFPVNSKI